MNYVFKTPCHPQAMGQKCSVGSEAFEMFFATDEGGELRILMGAKQMVSIVAMAICLMKDDPCMASEARKIAKTIQRT